MGGKRTTFGGIALPLALIAPQLFITIVFFVLPAAQSLWGSTLVEDAFGTRSEFKGLANFQRLFADETYLQSALTTLVFSVAVALGALIPALALAVLADSVTRGRAFYRTMLVWPYALAPAVAGVIWWFIFHPSIGIGAKAITAMGVEWNPARFGSQALILVILAAAWKQVAYSFLFFLAGLQSIPKSLIEAATLDGAGAMRRLVSIILPLLMPTTFFLIVVNMIYAFFDTFGVIHALTNGGPGQSTSILVFRVYRDGFEGQDRGISAAQSVVLLVVVGILTLLQFRYIERKITY